VKPGGFAFRAGLPAGSRSHRSRDFVDAPPGGLDGAYLAELAKFTVDDDALELREMDALARAPSALPEIEACRDYMRRKVITAEGARATRSTTTPRPGGATATPGASEFTAARALPERCVAVEDRSWRAHGPEKARPHIVRKTEDGFLERWKVS